MPAESSLHLFRGLLREIRKMHQTASSMQATRTELYNRFDQHRQVADPATLHRLRLDAQDILTFLHGNRRHKFHFNFPLANVADSQTLTLLHRIYERIAEVSVGLSNYVPNLDVLASGLNFTSLHQRYNNLHRIHLTIIKLTLLPALWHVYRTQRWEALNSFLDMHGPSAGGYDPYAQHTQLLRSSATFILTLATIHKDIHLITALTRRLEWYFNVYKSGSLDQFKRPFLDCLNAHGLGVHAKYLRAQWSIEYQPSGTDGSQCANEYWGTHWLNILPNGNLVMPFYANTFQFPDYSVSKIGPRHETDSESDNPSPNQSSGPETPEGQSNPADESDQLGSNSSTSI
ncbi:hypothetical protein H4R33_001646 [Dimargaris cristalligena]|nr:hypothetical protein H4R33_001646 [Dimargaris cristalligena]